MNKSENNITGNVEETKYSGFSKWRFLGAKSKAHNIYNLAIKNKISTNRIIEVGSGDGSVLAWLDGLNLSKDMHSIDISESGAKTIRERNIPSVTNVTTYDGYKMPYEDNYFDLAILSHVLEHVEYERILLRELCRVSKFQVIEVPLDYHDNIDKTWSTLNSYGHINVYTPTKLRFLLKSEGIKVVDDNLGLSDMETAEYSHFENSKRERIPQDVENFRLSYQSQIDNFNRLLKSQKEKSSSFYAVLTYKMSEKELFDIYLDDAYSYCTVNNLGVAKMILDDLIARGWNKNNELPAWAKEIINL